MLVGLAFGALALVGAVGAQNTQTSPIAVASAAATALTSHPTSNVEGAAFDRFVTIWLENTDFTKAAGDPNLQWLASKGITLENYFGVTHPSEPNYVSAIGGDNFGMDNDNFNQIPSNVFTVIDLLESAGISWSTYQEDMPYTGFEGYSWINQKTGANDYVRKHNPPVIYDANTNTQRLANQKNLTEFYADLAANTLPQWMFITPNMTDDGHDTTVTVAGAWTRSFLEPLLNNSTLMNNTLILVTFDETETYTIGNRVFSILLGDAVPSSLVGTTDSNFYNHFSEIATVEANWGLPTLGRWDVGANVFGFVADTTGDVVRAFDAATGDNPTYFYNQSYAGAFNQYNSSAPIPKPLLNATTSTGRRVAPFVVSAWSNSTAPVVYTTGVEAHDGLNPPAGYDVLIDEED